MSLTYTKLPADQLPALPFPGKLLVECDDGYETSADLISYETECTDAGSWSETEHCAGRYLDPLNGNQNVKT